MRGTPLSLLKSKNLTPAIEPRFEDDRLRFRSGLSATPTATSSFGALVSQRVYSFTRPFSRAVVKTMTLRRWSVNRSGGRFLSSWWAFAQTG